MAKQTPEQTSEDEEEVKVESEPDYSAWLTRSGVATKLGCSIFKVRALEKSGQLKGKFVNGEHRFDPKAVALLQAENGEEPDALTRSLANALSAAQMHAERSFGMVHDPAERILTKLLTRIEELEKKNNELQENAQKHIEGERDFQRQSKEDDRRHAMQVSAMQALTNLGLPLLAKKMGLDLGSLGGVATKKSTKADEPVSSPVDHLSTDQKLAIFGHLANLLQSLTPEQIKYLEGGWPAGHYEAIKGVYNMLTGNAV